MVQIKENWTAISGTVLAMSAAPLEGFATIRVLVNDAAAVDGFANMLAEAKGTEMEILARDSFVASAGIAVGDRLRCRVRRAGTDRFFLHDQHCTKEDAADEMGRT